MEPSPTPGILKKEIDEAYETIKKETTSGGYYLNPDPESAKDLVEGLIVNRNRYGYESCPCRLASGVKSEDLDIICPCDYRDADIDEFGACYCALYVSKECFEGRQKIRSIPERRPPKEIRAQKSSDAHDENSSAPSGKSSQTLKYPVWRCKVCGYLCARDTPPGICPVCKADKERFERFM